MKRRFTVVAGVAVALVWLLFTSCIVESERPIIRGPWLDDSNNHITGFIPVSATGYMGGSITVLLWLNDQGVIGWMEFDLRAETQRHVAPLPGAIQPIILHTNSFNFPVTIVSGATRTALILTNAVREAFIERGVAPEDVGF